MAIPAKRMTFRLHQPTLEGIDALVRGGAAPSRNALIEKLVEQALRGFQRREHEAQAEKMYRTAFGDGAYAAEQAEITRAFGSADAESARLVDQ